MAQQFIVIEGLDGSGKSTASKLLTERFLSHNLPCFHTCEPTNSPIGTLIRSILTGKEKPVSNETMALLFAADRTQHLTDEILPLLTHSNVICDRYYYSNMAYQGSDEESLERVVQYNQTAIAYGKPDITFFINVTPEECMRRVEKRGESISIYETLPKLKLQHERFMAAFERMKKTDNMIIVGSDTMSPNEIVDEMWSYLTPTT